MATADVTFDRVLGYARQLPAKEQAQLIGALAQGLVDETPPRTIDKMVILEGIWENLRKGGHVPPTADEVMAYIENERNSWND